MSVIGPEPEPERARPLHSQLPEQTRGIGTTESTMLEHATVGIEEHHVQGLLVGHVVGQQQQDASLRLHSELGLEHRARHPLRQQPPLETKSGLAWSSVLLHHLETIDRTHRATR